MRLVATLLFLIVMLMVWGALFELGLAGGWLAVMAVTAVLSFVAVLVHELGHAFAVHRSGGRIHAIVVLPFELRLAPIRFKLARRPSRRDIGGYVTFSANPAETRRQHIAIAAAGPVANFALAALALSGSVWVTLASGVGSGVPLLELGSAGHPSAYASLPSDAVIEEVVRSAHSSWISGQSVALLANALAILSAGMGAVNLLPFRGSDGQAIMRARRRKHWR